MNSSKINKKFRKINNLPYLPTHADANDHPTHASGAQHPQMANVMNPAQSQAHHSVGQSGPSAVNYQINPKTGNFFRRNTSNQSSKNPMHGGPKPSNHASGNNSPGENVPPQNKELSPAQNRQQ